MKRVLEDLSLKYWNQHGACNDYYIDYEEVMQKRTYIQGPKNM